MIMFHGIRHVLNLEKYLNVFCYLSALIIGPLVGVLKKYFDYIS